MRKNGNINNKNGVCASVPCLRSVLFGCDNSKTPVNSGVLFVLERKQGNPGMSIIIFSGYLVLFNLPSDNV